jgi:DNA-binding NarL/FixJ family response regulator
MDGDRQAKPSAPAADGTTVRIVLADDETLVRAGLRLLLAAEQGLVVVGEAGDGIECLKLVESAQPDVVVMGLRMPVMDGIEATARVTSAADHPAVLILTTFTDEQDVITALRAGAAGFLLKNSAPQTLATAIRTLARGEGWLDPAITMALLRQFSARVPGQSVPHADVGVLTVRERDVLRAMAAGLKNAQIAELLCLRETTVKTHVHRILLKLGLSDRSQAVAVAYRSGLVRAE